MGVTYNPYSRAFQEAPYPLYRRLRDETPCAYNTEMDFYALFRFEDVWNATLDWETMSSSLGPNLENRGQLDPELQSLIAMDPPRHTRLRNIVSRGFTPRRIAALEDAIRAVARGYLDRLAGLDSFDFQQEFAARFPMDVIGLLLGIPEEDRDAYRASVDMGLERDPDSGMNLDAVEALKGAQEFVAALIERRRQAAGDDLISLILDAEYEDVDGEVRRLTDAQCIALVNLLGSAGAETTAKLLGHSLYLLWKHPDQRDLVFGDVDRIPNAIEEILRYEAPSQFQGRVAHRESTWHGVTIPVGARVAPVTGSACRDEREFEDPDRFDVTRTHDRELYFGHGHHVCIGKSLARLETRVALEEIAARFPRYEVDESGMTHTYQAHVQGYTNVPISTGR
jgi:cytochrome P450